MAEKQNLRESDTVVQPAEQLQKEEQFASSATGVTSDAPAALIEEAFDSGLRKLLEDFEPALNFAQHPKDILDDRYTIFVGQPLPEFDTTSAKAYAAADKQNDGLELIAYVYTPDMPMREKALNALVSMTHPNLQNLHAFGAVALSHTSRMNIVMFMDRPKGQRLSELIAEGTGYNERQIIDTIITPLYNALTALKEKNISHGCVNPYTIYVGETLMLGECVCEPAGMSQPAIYEPIERALCSINGKGSPGTKTDSYAIGMLVYELLYGLDKFKQASFKEYSEKILEFGSYNLLSATHEFPDAFVDFFRGILAENKEDRWGLTQIGQWIDGKRFNLIHPSVPSEASRPLLFAEQEYVSRRALANGIFHHWDEAMKELRGAKVDRWLEMSVHRSELAEKVERIISMTGGEYTTNPRSNMEMAARVISLLDPHGPLRINTLALHVDGMGLTLANAVKENLQQDIATLLNIINFDLPTFWSELTEEPKTPETSTIVWQLQQMRSYLNLTGIGFSMERIMYDLNPSLPCQSELIQPYIATNVKEVLMALDAKAKTMATDSSLIDRHVAAYLASKIDIKKEISFSQLSKLPDLRNDPELQVLKILALAQEKKAKEKMVGLATWAAMRMDKVLHKIHNRKLRKTLQQQLKRAASSGKVLEVISIVLDEDITGDDYEGFSRAQALYHYNVARIDLLRNPKKMELSAKDLGGRIAVFIAYIVLCITCYLMLDQYVLEF